MKDRYIEAAKALLDLSTTSGSISSMEELEKVDEIFSSLKGSMDSEGVREVRGWYIPSVDSFRVEWTDIITINMMLMHSNGEAKEIFETLHPPTTIDERGVIVEEYGGQGKAQQAIVLTISGETKDGRGGADACIQLEIDYRTGEFKAASLRNWDVDLEDDLEGDSGDDDEE